MGTQFLRIISIAAVLAVSFQVTGCTKKPKADEGAEHGGVTSSDIAGDLADSDSGKAMGLETIHYAYDSAVLDGTAKKILKANAALLKDKSSVKIQLEGHTDERGGIQYNIALGERRANSAKSFLIAHGISADRVTTISYGKEKPLDSGHDESAWSKNRRANFRITEK